MKKRPKIGVTGPVKGGMVAWIMTWLALQRAGGRPFRITVKTKPEKLHFDALIIGGGSDINPESYGEDLQVIKEVSKKKKLRYRLWSAVLFLLRLIFSLKTGTPTRDEARDRLESDLCLRALDHGLPVLGICRGEQLINVALGGTLHQDTRGFYAETPNLRTILSRKGIHLKENTKLRKILGGERFRVNSLHSQAVKDLGKDLIVTAVEDNTIVQAIEHTRHPFMLGVQWHPEYLPQVKTQQRLFRALVEAAGKPE